MTRVASPMRSVSNDGLAANMRGFRTEPSGKRVNGLFSIVYMNISAAVYSFVHNLRPD